jgi:hypothetical protein
MPSMTVSYLWRKTRDTNVYAQQTTTVKNQGGYMSLVLGQEDLYSNSTSTNILGSINKELWVGIEPKPIPGEPPSCWFEAGQKKGGVLKDLSQGDDLINPQQINWSGHFLGYRLWEANKGKFVFHATPYGAISPTGQHSYQIKLTNASTGEWKFYVDGTQALTLPGAYCRDNTNAQKVLVTESVGLSVGIESKDTTNSFKNGTYVTGWQFLGTNGIWYFVTNVANQDTQGVANYNKMNSTFTYTASPSENNKVILNHN